MEILNTTIESISNAAGNFLPGTIGAILILIIGWFIAGILKRVITKLIAKTGIDKKLQSNKITISKFIGKLVYFITMIFVFTLVLEKLGLQSVLDPVKDMLDGFLGFVPKLVGAILIGYIGYMLATMVSELVGLSGDTIHKFIPNKGTSDSFDIVGILKKVVFLLIFIPLLIAALNVLDMNTISEPATAMLAQFFDAIPKVLLASLILIFFVFGGKFITQMLKDILEKMNLDSIVEQLHLGETVKNKNIPAIIANIAYFFIILFGLMTALEKLEFLQLTEIMDTITNISGKIVFGLIIILIGNWASIMAKNAFGKSGKNTFVSSIIRTAILAIFLAMGLKTMGMGDDIINMAFGITLGTVAITIALSFGLGGREAAGKQMQKILEKFNS